MFNFLKRKGSGIRVVSPHVKGETMLKARATMAPVVRRFQGTYECGCFALPLISENVDSDELTELHGPELCEVHNLPRRYVLEHLEVQTEMVEIPESLAQAVFQED